MCFAQVRFKSVPPDVVCFPKAAQHGYVLPPTVIKAYSHHKANYTAVLPLSSQHLATIITRLTLHCTLLPLSSQHLATIITRLTL